MATNADSMCPTASGLIRAEYPVTTPRDSSRRTRDCTADTDKPGGRRQMGQRGATVGDELAHQDPVDLVERFAHGRRLSEPGAGPMSKQVETWQLRARFAAALSRMYGAEVPAYTTLVDVSAEVNRAGSGTLTAAHFPATDDEMASSGLAYYHGGDPSKPVVYEDFLPASAAGIFRSNLDTDAQKAAGEADRDAGLQPRIGWPGTIGHHIHDPYELYEKVASP